jgi:hypothetical protein
LTSFETVAFLDWIRDLETCYINHVHTQGGWLAPAAIGK